MLGQLAAGTVIAGYEIIRGLGRGGMGDVYLARKIDGEQRHVALKLLSVGLAQDTRFKERFERESHMATSLEHPHIIPVYATGDVGGVRYIAMRYVDGPTLRELIDGESPLDPRRSLSLLHQVASALDDAHEIGLVHRDVKPANVLIARGGASEFREHAYLTDFGVSKYTGSESGFTKTGQFVGTSLYAAPEQIQGDRIGGRTDVYAFGCVLFESLTGTVPFEKETEAALLWAQMFEPAPSISSVRTDLPGGLDEVIAKAMAKAPSERYATCGDVVRAAWGALAAPVPRTTKTTPGESALAPPPEALPIPAGTTVLKDAQVLAPGEPAAAPASTRVAKPGIVPEVERGDTPAEELGTGDRVSEVGAETVLKEPGPAVLETGAAAAVVSEADVDVEEVPDVESDDTREEIVAGTLSAQRGPPSGETLISEPARPAAPPPPWTPTPRPRERPRPAAAGRNRRRTVLAAGGAVALVAVGVLAAILVLGGGDDNGGGTTSTAPTSVKAPSIAGQERAGNTLRATRGRWGNSPTEFTYQWRRCRARTGPCGPIAGATSAEYLLRDRDVGRYVKVSITASNDAGRATRVSGATTAVAPPFTRPSNTSAPTISGEAHPGERLTADKGSWRGTGPISYAYIWKRCNASGGSCVPIEGARGQTYTLRSQDVGRTVRVEVRASSRVGRAAMATKATPTVHAVPVPVPDPPCCAPTPTPVPIPDPPVPPDP